MMTGPERALVDSGFSVALFNERDRHPLREVFDAIQCAPS